ncbi:MAG TPA: DUF3006 domain-containing protein [Firmicutes bacterium]|nr:DUF3006 domain-containing protein [Bacillota bacterium]
MPGEELDRAVAVALTVTVDRFEEDKAVLLVREKDEGATILFPRRFLPPGTREGSILRLYVDEAREEESAARRRVEGLLARLTGREGTASPGNEPE